VTPEAKVKKRVRKVLDELDAYYVMPVTGGYGSSGAPDFLVCYRGKFIGIECKAGDNQPTALQFKNLRRIQDCGGAALVVNEHNVDQLQLIVESGHNGI